MERRRLRRVLSRMARLVGRGVVLGRYRSAYDGAPCVAVAILRGNRKTGPMVQVWFIPEDGNFGSVRAGGMGPMVGQASVCPAACVHRPDNVRARRARGIVTDGCYVLPSSVWAVRDGLSRGIYRTDVSVRALVSWANVNDVGIRIGAWGDVGSVPAGHPMLPEFARARFRTGYSHSWAVRPDLRGLVMASVDSPGAASRARAAGWGLFYSGRTPIDFGQVCLTERDPDATCVGCWECDGRAVAIKIPPHGFDVDRSTAAKRSLPML